MKVLGLTGSIASGKSTVSGILRLHGGYILDADEINHYNMLRGNRAYKEIIDVFGRAILDEDSEIDRSLLGEKVFSHKAKLSALEEIAHRHVKEYTLEKLKELEAEGTHVFCVIDAPLLIEANMQFYCDSVWLVFADTHTRVKRLLSRNNYTHEQALARINAQTPYSALLKHADTVIYNAGTREELEARVDRELLKFLK